MRVLGLAALALAALTTGANACGTGRLVFSDDFNTLSKDWGVEDNFMKVRNGELVIAETAGRSYAVYAKPSYRSVDYCATLRLSESSDLSKSYGGIMFWARDIDHYYTFEVTLDGYATVYEYAEDWKNIIEDREFPPIKKGIGAVNELRVVTKGPLATFYVNDRKFDSINIKSAPGTQRIGFTIEAPSGTDGRTTFAFDNVEVREVTTTVGDSLLKSGVTSGSGVLGP